MRTFGHILDNLSIQAKRQKRFDIGVLRDVVASTEGGRWPGALEVLKVTGPDDDRTMYLATDSATALLLSYDLDGILARINPLLGVLAVQKVRVVHRTPKAV